MALLRFFRVPKHRQFEYKPRHWDPDKEEKEKRLQRVREIQESGVEASKTRISGSFRKGYKGNENYRRSQVVRSNLILVGVIIVLLVLSYFFLQEFLPTLSGTLMVE